MAKSKRGFLEPKVGDPDLVRKHKNGLAVNPPSYMEMGGFTKPADLMRGETLLNRQPGSPTAQKNKPI